MTPDDRRRRAAFASAVSRSLREHGVDCLPAASPITAEGPRVRAVGLGECRIVAVYPLASTAIEVTDVIVMRLTEIGYRTTRTADDTVYVHRTGSAIDSEDTR